MAEPDPERKLTQTEAWFRDTLYKLLGWFAATLFLFAGWLLSGKDTFRMWNTEGKGLMILAPIVYVAWARAIWSCYGNCPRFHKTVPPKTRLIRYTIGYSVVLAFLVAMALDVFDPNRGSQSDSETAPGTIVIEGATVTIDGGTVTVESVAPISPADAETKPPPQ